MQQDDATLALNVDASRAAKESVPMSFLFGVEVGGAIGEGELVQTALVVVAAAVVGEGADAPVVTTCAEVGVEGTDAVPEDGGVETPITVVACGDEGVVAGFGVKDFGEVVVDATEDAAGVGGAAVDAAGVVASMVGAEVAEADSKETPFMRSRILFNHRNFSSIRDTEDQRSATSTVVQFNLGENFGRI